MVTGRSHHKICSQRGKEWARERGRREVSKEEGGRGREERERKRERDFEPALWLTAASQWCF